MSQQSSAKERGSSEDMDYEKQDEEEGLGEVYPLPLFLFLVGSLISSWFQDEEFEEAEEEVDEDEDDDMEELQPRAFAVSGKPDFNSGPPATAMEYLRRVK